MKARSLSPRALCWFLLAASVFPAQAADHYPPAGVTQPAQIVRPPDGRFRLEEWFVEESRRETWLVSNAGEAFRLPEIPIMHSKVDSGSVALASVYQFSPDAKYLFRSQKIGPGQTGAYVYERVQGIEYRPAVPDLYIRASEYFTRQTNIQWYRDTPDVVFMAWQSDDALEISLSGSSKDRRYDISGWHCVFSPQSGQFSIPAADVAENRATIRNADTPAVPVPPPASLALPPMTAEGAPAVNEVKRLLRDHLYEAPPKTMAEADARLNEAYRQVREHLNAAARERLKADEIAWLRERDRISDPAQKILFVEQRRLVLLALLHPDEKTMARSTAELAAMTLGASSPAPPAPAPAAAVNNLPSPDGNYSIQFIRMPLPGADNAINDCTLSLLRGQTSLCQAPTFGYVTTVNWSGDEKYVAVNNRRGNSGDYVWIFALPSGQVLKRPDDAIGSQWEKAAAHAMEQKIENLQDARFNRGWVTTTGWSGGQLQVHVRNLYYDVGAIDFQGTASPPDWALTTVAVSDIQPVK